MRSARRRLLLAVPALLATATLAACGSDDEETASTPMPPASTAKAEDFPAAASRSLADLQSSAAEGPILAPAVASLKKGTNRFAFALFDAARKQISGAQVAVYVGRPDGTGVRGPFPARSESLVVKPQFQSRQNAEDPDAAKAVYVADVDFPRNGNAVVLGIARLDGRLLSTGATTVRVGLKGPKPPDVGDRAIKISTDTRATAGGDLSSIDTRIPPVPAFHEVDFADVLGKEPIVLLFATPQLCASRVCGPVYDIAYQVQSQVGGKVRFIQQEIYNDNQVNAGFRKQVVDWKLPSEPWVFVIDRQGKVVDRLEGAFSVGELERAVAKVLT